MQLKHTTLYAKGWYLRTELVEDLKVVLGADGYMPDNASDVVNILINNIVPFNGKKRAPELLMMQILSDADPKNVWKVGYYKEEKEEYDYHRAIIQSFLSVLSTSSVKDLDGLPDPDYTILPKHYEDYKFELADDGATCLTPCEFTKNMIGSGMCMQCSNLISVNRLTNWVTCKGIKLKENN